VTSFYYFTCLPRREHITISFYQREGFIIQYEGLDEATGEKERPVSVLDMSLARIGEL
jgi:hypothetical protein